MKPIVSDKPTDDEKTMVIREITPRITTFSVPFWRADAIPFGGRATVVQLKTGSLAVFSPVPLTETIKKMIGQQSVGYIVAPDIEHHLHLSAWHDAYPTAKLIGPEGLQEKREKAGTKYGTPFKFDYIFTRENKGKLSLGPEIDDEFDYEYLPVHPNREIVFNHRPDKTLIEADLLFNLPATEQFSQTKEKGNFLTRAFASWALSPSAIQKGFIYYGFSNRGNRAFDESIRKIAGWDFDRIIPCHGDVVEKNGKAFFKNVMSWNLKETAQASESGNL